ncbi:unnamed protein product [Heterobilharzia americana]|nr:unnamed protein product [Heterobilharzia americana]
MQYTHILSHLNCLKWPLKVEDLEKCKHLCLFGYVFDILKDENFDCMHGVYVNLTGYVPGIYLDPMGEPTNYLEKLMQCWDLIDQENKRLFMMFSKCDLRTDGDQAYGFCKPKISDNQFSYMILK